MCCFGEDGNYEEKKPISSKKRRGCTDCICFLIFVLFLVGLACLTALTVLDDGFDRLLYGYDSFGNICDRPNRARPLQKNFQQQDTTGLKYVLYFDYLKPADSFKVCVRTCPNVTITSVAQFSTYAQSINESLCFYNVTPGIYDRNQCPKLPILETTPILNRCVPTPNISSIIPSQLDHIANISGLFNSDDLRLATLTLYKQLPDIGLLALIAIGLTVLLVIMLRYLAKIMVLLIVFLSCIGMIALSIYLWLQFNFYLKSNGDEIHTVPIFNYQMQAKNAFLTYSIISSVLTVILILIMLVTRKRIFLLLRLIAEAQKALGDMPMLFVMPLFTFLVLLMFLFYWLITAIMIYSFQQFDIGDLTVIPGQNVTFTKQTITIALWLYHVIALIWISEFIFGCQSMVIAGSVVKWYFTKDKRNLKTPILTSLRRLIVFHLGSVALGSFLIAMVRLPRYILIYFQDKIKASQSSFIKGLSKACICCLWLLERFLKFINYNAYTIIAIEGKSFCVSAQKAFVLIIENSMRVAVINSIGDFFLFLSKVIVTAATLVIAVFILEVPIDDGSHTFEQYKFFIMPMIIVGIVAFLIAHSFFTVYEMVIDAILVCFCEDSKANDGSEDRPYYMSSSLKKFIDESSTTNILH